MKFVCESIEDILKPKDLDIEQKWLWAFKHAKDTTSALRIYKQAKQAGIKLPAKELLEFAHRINNLQLYREAVDRLTTNPDKKLSLAAQFGDLDYFIDILNQGGRVSFNLLRKLNGDYHYYRSTGTIYPYVAENLDSVMKEEDLQKAHDALDAKDQEYKSYPKGYKQYRVLKYINDNKVTRRLELIKLIYELGYGPGSFNEIKSASYWSANYRQIIGQYYDVGDDGVFELNEDGRDKLQELEAKFGQRGSLKRTIDNIKPYR